MIVWWWSATTRSLVLGFEVSSVQHLSLKTFQLIGEGFFFAGLFMTGIHTKQLQIPKVYAGGYIVVSSSDSRSELIGKCL